MIESGQDQMNPARQTYMLYKTILCTKVVDLLFKVIENRNYQGKNEVKVRKTCQTYMYQSSPTQNIVDLFLTVPEKYTSPQKLYIYHYEVMVSWILYDRHLFISQFLYIQNTDVLLLIRKYPL